MLRHYIILWKLPASRIAFEADMHATDPREALRLFREIFPDDLVCGVKLHRGNGRFIA